MIAKKFRFHGHAALKFVFARGAQKRSKLFAVKYVANPRRHSPRVAVIISKKIFKHAVDRNRARRRVYEIARRSVRSFAKKNAGVDIAISLYRPEVNDTKSEELIAELVPILREIFAGK